LRPERFVKTPKEEKKHRPNHQGQGDSGAKKRQDIVESHDQKQHKCDRDSSGEDAKELHVDVFNLPHL
jgi:hypothetical protein